MTPRCCQEHRFSASEIGNELTQQVDIFIRNQLRLKEFSIAGSCGKPQRWAALQEQVKQALQRFGLTQPTKLPDLLGWEEARVPLSNDPSTDE